MVMWSMGPGFEVQPQPWPWHCSCSGIFGSKLGPLGGEQGRMEAGARGCRGCFSTGLGVSDCGVAFEFVDVRVKRCVYEGS